jgi:hypothetical protein
MIYSETFSFHSEELFIPQNADFLFSPTYLLLKKLLDCGRRVRGICVQEDKVSIAWILKKVSSSLNINVNILLRYSCTQINLIFQKSETILFHEVYGNLKYLKKRYKKRIMDNNIHAVCS